MSCSALPFALRVTPDDIVRQIRHIPSAPRVLPKLKRLLTDGNSSIHEIVALVRLDPGIAARVLQVGNSAYFSQGLRCYTVDEAVQRVGYDQIYELVAAAVASQVLIRPLATYSVDEDELWQSSVSCAIAAEILAEKLNIDRDIAYTVGLLHRIGMVAIDEWLHRVDPNIRFRNAALPLETCEAERAVLGFHNAEAGASLLRLWEFPPVMTEPVRWQYLPNATAAHGQLAALLHAAKYCRTQVRDISAVDAMPDIVILKKLGISNSQLQQVQMEVRNRLQAIGSMLEEGHQESVAVKFPSTVRVLPD